MAEFSDDLKLEVVTRLARFEAPSDIMADLQSRSIDTDATQIGRYDPTRPYYASGDKWREVFEAARQAYLTDVTAVPIANQGYRLNELHKLFAKAVKDNKPDLAIRIAEQCSKEVGGQFTNARELSISDSRRPKPADMTQEDRQNMMAEIIRKAIEGMPTPPGQQPQQETVQ